MGILSNVHRTEQSDKARIHIGRGLQLVKNEQGDVWIRTLSEHPVFVQSFHLDHKAGREPGDAVHKIYPNCYIKVFDLKQCHNEIWKRFLLNQRKQQQQTAQISAGQGVSRMRNSYNNDCGVDDLRKLCVLRMSFVKGWGPDYIRQSIRECPCWIEVTFNEAMKHLDKVLLQNGIVQSMGMPPTQSPPQPVNNRIGFNSTVAKVATAPAQQNRPQFMPNGGQYRNISQNGGQIPSNQVMNGQIIPNGQIINGQIPNGQLPNDQKSLNFTVQPNQVSIQPVNQSPQNQVF